MTRRNINFDQLWIIGFTAISSQHHLPRRASLNTFSQSVDHSRRIQVNQLEMFECAKAACLYLLLFLHPLGTSCITANKVL